MWNSERTDFIFILKIGGFSFFIQATAVLCFPQGYHTERGKKRGERELIIVFIRGIVGNKRLAKGCLASALWQSAVSSTKKQVFLS